MILKDLVALTSIGISVVCCTAYVRAILKKQTKPHLFSWIVWFVVDAIVAAALFASGAGVGSWPPLAASVVCLIVTILAFLYGEKNITRSDWLFFLGAVAAIPLWLLTKDPLWSVVLVTAIDVSAMVPTIRKSYLKPWEENLTMFGLTTVAFGLAMIALESYSWTTMLFLVTMFVVNGAFSVVLVLWRRAAPVIA